MHPVILIPARLASTRLPEKPLADIAGVPMIVHVWRRATQAGIGPVYVACDDARIKKAVEGAGGKAILTRVDHLSGSDRIFEALGIIDPQKHFDVVVNVQGDVPTIDPKVIRAVLEPLQVPATDIATLACEIKDEHERNDPSVVKPVFTAWRQGNIRGSLTFTRDWTPAPPHNETPFHHIGIYAYRRPALEKFVSLPPSPSELRERLEQLRALDAGMRIDVAIVNTIPLGVDTPEHLERARKIVAGK